MPRLTFRRLHRLLNWSFLLACLALAFACLPSLAAPTDSRHALALFESRVGSGWQFPVTRTLRENAGRPIPPVWADSFALLRKQVLQPRWEPPPNLKWTYVRVRKDPVEAVAHEFGNYIYAAWTSHGATLWAKCYAFDQYVLIQPASALGGPDLWTLLGGGGVGGPPARRVPDRKSAAVLQTLWKQFLKPHLPAFSGRSAPTLFVTPPLVEVSLEDSSHLIYSLHTDGRSVALQAYFGRRGEQLLDRLWGGRVTHPPIRPLNPSLVSYSDPHRWWRRSGYPPQTNTPSKGARRQIMIEATASLMHSGWWYTGPHLRRAETYLVPVVAGRIPAATWRACEFQALTEAALRASEETSWVHWQWVSQYGRGRSAQWHLAQKARDHTRVAEAYARIKVPAGARALHEKICALLRGEERLWKMYLARSWELRSANISRARYQSVMEDLRQRAVVGTDGESPESLHNSLLKESRDHFEHVVGSDAPIHDA